MNTFYTFHTCEFKYVYTFVPYIIICYVINIHEMLCCCCCCCYVLLKCVIQGVPFNMGLPTIEPISLSFNNR